VRGVRGQTRKIPRQFSVILCSVRADLVLSSTGIARHRDQDRPICDKELPRVRSPSGTKVIPEKQSSPAAQSGHQIACYRRSADEALPVFNMSAQLGLSNEEAAARRGRYGKNELARK